MNLAISPIKNNNNQINIKKNNSNINFGASRLTPEVKTFIKTYLPEFGENEEQFLFISEKSRKFLKEGLSRYCIGMFEQLKIPFQVTKLIEKYPNVVLNAKDIDRFKTAKQGIEYPLLQVICDESKPVTIESAKEVFAKHAQNLLELEKTYNEKNALSHNLKNYVEKSAAERARDYAGTKLNELIPNIYKELGLID